LTSVSNQELNLSPVSGAAVRVLHGPSTLVGSTRG